MAGMTTDPLRLDDVRFSQGIQHLPEVRVWNGLHLPAWNGLQLPLFDFPHPDFVLKSRDRKHSVPLAPDVIVDRGLEHKLRVVYILKVLELADLENHGTDSNDQNGSVATT